MELNPNQPQSQTKVPPPPTPEVSVRTMQSDIRSVGQGEVNPTPEVVSPKQQFNSQAQSFAPDMAGQMLSEEAAVPKKSRTGLWVIIFLVVFIALAAIGYFVIYPMMSAPVAEPITEVETPVAAEPTPVALAPHTSAFAGSVIAIPQSISQIDPVSRETILQALTDQGVVATTGLTEILIQDATGGQLSFPTLLTALLPEFLDGQSVGTYATDDFTAYLHKDATGVWPGYIIPLRPEGVTILNQWLANFEKTDLRALFLTDPGTLAAFKDGTVKGIADRFATGVTAGASLSYAVTATDLHISTSFEGLKAALTALGY